MKLRVVEPPKNIFKTQVGEMWRASGNDHDGRECWFIHLPGDAFWYTTAPETGRDGWNHWQVEGEPPNITVTPSIDAVGRWHGFITNGEIVGA